jgi:hypothetical protein
MDIAGITLGFIAVIGGLAIAPFSIFLGIRQAQRKREMEHIERMKALELGRTLPQDEPWLSPTKIGAAIGILVPIAALTAAADASRQVGYHEELWLAATLVGITGLISGPILVFTSARKSAAPSASLETKPYVAEDAYDVVSSRG